MGVGMTDNQDRRLLYVGLGMLLLASVAAWGVVALKWVAFIWLMLIAASIARLDKSCVLHGGVGCDMGSDSRFADEALFF